MSDSSTDVRHAVALLRYGVIVGLARKAHREYAIPGSARPRITPEPPPATGSNATAPANSPRGQEEQPVDPCVGGVSGR